MNTQSLSKEMELRHLSTQHQLQLVRLLDIDDSILSLLMGNIVKNLDDTNSELRFNSMHIDAIREHSQEHSKPGILVLLDEWSTMGKIRPKLKHLFDLLIKCQLFQAADYLADLLNEPRPERPTNGPAAYVDISLSPNDNIDEIVNDLNYPFSSIDLTTKANRINNYVKPDINTPNMNDYMKNVSRNGQSKIFNQPQPLSDLIKFSKTMTTQLVPEPENLSFGIPATVNEHGETSTNVPALSGLMTSQDSEEQLPVFLNSMKSSESPIPDFSGLMNNVSTNSNSSSDQSQSITDSTINTS